MAIASALSIKREGLSKLNGDRISELLQKFDLPIHMDGNWEPVFDALEKDKKKTGNDIYFVLLKDIGKAVVRRISKDEVIAMTRQLMTEEIT